LDRYFLSFFFFFFLAFFILLWLQFFILIILCTQGFLFLSFNDWRGWDRGERFDSSLSQFHRPAPRNRPAASLYSSGYTCGRNSNMGGKVGHFFGIFFFLYYQHEITRCRKKSDLKEDCKKITEKKTDAFNNLCSVSFKSPFVCIVYIYIHV